MQSSVFVRRLQLLDSFTDIVGPRLCPPTQLGDRWLVEPVGGKLRVVDPVGPDQPCLKLAEVERVAGVAPSKLFQLDGAPAVGRGLYVDQIPGQSAVGQCANLGADDIFLPWTRRSPRTANSSRPRLTTAAHSPRIC